ncbi:MAG: glycosyl transferase protein [Segetibacter sp.]|nr:glycosyl transferase protein [Segetibacter sp.]
MKPQITILMPVYNAEKYLAEAIDSILHQSFSNFEFLIIDDGSTDTSIDIIRSYSDSRIHLVRNEKNLGISATLNKGIDLSSTELIARMDADDISYPTRIEAQLEFFRKNPDCALLSAWAREIAEDKTPIYTSRFNSNFYYCILIFECWIYHPTVMYKKSAVKDVGAYSVPYCEDYDLWWKLSRKYKIANLSEVLLDYRSTDDSLCRVSKRVEYETAHKEQLLRNVRYYTGENFTLSDNEIECLRFNCEPLLMENDLRKIVSLFKKLQHINSSILKKENDNNELKHIKEAMAYKKQSIFEWFAERLSRRRQLLLLISIGEPKMLFRKIFNIN